MKLVLLCVGKPRDRALAALHDDYAARIRRFGVPYDARWVPEARGSAGHLVESRRREADRIRDSLEGGTVVALDAAGALLTSEAVAAKLERWATPRATFVVGGPMGLDPRLIEEAGAIWSLSPLTFPHELVRVLVAEQIYRAMTIRRGLPYHK